MYHRVTKSEMPAFLPSGLNCPASRFQEHLAILKRHYSIFPLEEVWNLVRGGRRLPPGTVVLTFDDCWYENMETVAHPLADDAIPATFFVSAGDIDREELHPNHRFYYLGSRVGRKQLTRGLQSMLPPSSMVPSEAAGPWKLRLWLESTLGYELASQSGCVFLDTLEQGLGAPSSIGLGKTLYMTSDQVRSLPRLGIQVGNHTVNHRQLSALDEAGQRAELAEAQRILSALTGKPVTTLAYPYGRHEDFNEISVTVAAELGHRLACTVIPGYNDGDTDPMRLRRINASQLSGKELAFRILGAAS
jgi:peptidoglycan/xylan/chitin deacetylase (PgdA/CDA1 family)